MPVRSEPTDGPAALTPVETPRVALARLVLRAAEACPGVVATDPGPGRRFGTWAGTEHVPGVVVAAEGTGPAAGYAVAVRLVAAPVPLQALGEDVRAAIRDAARRAGVADRVGEVQLAVTDVVGPLTAAAR